MDISIKCTNCGQILGFGDMTKQSVKQSAKQAFNWKVMLGLKEIDYVPACEGCGASGKEHFCCPKCESKEIWSEDILKSGNLIHKCNPDSTPKLSSPPPSPPSPPSPINVSKLDNALPTTESHQGLASVADRFLARLIDTSAITLISLIIPFIGAIVGLVYLLIMDALPFLNGQSLGKRLMKIRVVDAESEKPITEDYSKAALRSIPFIIPIFFIVDGLMVLSDDRKRFGDKWAKTKVIKEVN